LIQPCRDLLIVLIEQLSQFSYNPSVFLVDEREGATGVSGTACTTDAVDVIVDVGREVVVDDLGDVRDIQATGGDVRCTHDRRITALERAEGILTLTLTLVTVNGTSRETTGTEDVFDVVTVSFRFLLM
jgi:hypothetical protein